MNNLERCDRLDRFISEGRVIRRQWGDGMGRACLLAAYAPEVCDQHSSDACPADALWPWLAQMVPSIDDNGSEAAWPDMVKRFAAVMRKIAALPPERWEEVGRRCEVRVHDIAQDEATRNDAPRLETDRNVLMMMVRAAVGVTVDRAAEQAAWDRMTDALLTAIEEECGR